MLRQPELVPLESAALYHQPVFVLKRLDLVVFTLIDDIVDDVLLVTNAARKSTILFSPSFEVAETRLLLSPLAATLLDVPHQVTQAYCWGQFDQYVHMVTNAIDSQQSTITTLNNGVDISIQLLIGFIGYGHLTTQCVDDNVE